MTGKRTFANVCSISDRHVLDLLPLFELETSDPLFDGEFWSWQPDMAESEYWTDDSCSRREQKNSRRLSPGKPLTAIEPPGNERLCYGYNRQDYV